MKSDILDLHQGLKRFLKTCFTLVFWILEVVEDNTCHRWNSHTRIATKQVTPRHGVTRFGVKGKLASRYVGPFEVIERIGEVTYRLNLPAWLAHVHNMLHMSMLRKYTPNLSHVIEYEAIPLQDVTYEEQPIKILAKELKGQGLMEKSQRRRGYLGVRMHLRPLTKHPRKRIQTLATDLIEIWKNIVIKETSKDIQNGKLANKPSFKLESPKAESHRPSKFQKTSSGKIEKGFKAKSIKVEKVERNVVESIRKINRDVMKPATMSASSTPKITSMIISHDVSRDRVRDMLHEALSKDSSEADGDMLDDDNACDHIRVAVTVESVLFENWGGATGAQKVKYRSLMFNLKDPKNHDFCRNVLLGQVKAERLVDMSTTEMATDGRQQQNKMPEEKALFDCERGLQREATTDQFKCGRCEKRRTTYYQMQM
ncbi:transcription elongation factor TFIIS-like [Cannabis sativa]|uniref:transcription elongation factor TFIIS-like n=1 Tax=Cannabis sativa TaxID=3483 RepID=UPI0029CAA8DB|nr:transcription elongation factor TFIIS-like [Cannabis sativa]